MHQLYLHVYRLDDSYWMYDCIFVGEVVSDHWHITASVRRVTERRGDHGAYGWTTTWQSKHGHQCHWNERTQTHPQNQGMYFVFFIFFLWFTVFMLISQSAISHIVWWYTGSTCNQSNTRLEY